MTKPDHIPDTGTMVSSNHPKSPDSSKPSWDDAPAWARYLMRAVSGRWWWLECEPLWRKTQWYCVEGMSEIAEENDYKPILEERPR